jgi:hypothetical protein
MGESKTIPHRQKNAVEFTQLKKNLDQCRVRTGDLVRVKDTLKQLSDDVEIAIEKIWAY